MRKDSRGCTQGSRELRADEEFEEGEGIQQYG